MISLIFVNKRKRDRAKPEQVTMAAEEDLVRDAVAIVGLLKTDEDKLEEQAKALVKNKKDYAKRVFSASVEQWTPFHAFALRGCRKLVKLALKSGVDANLQMGEPEGVPGKCTALHLAAHRGDVSIIDILLQNGANVNQVDAEGRTPIFYAARAHNSLAVKHLKRSGADMSQCQGDALSPGINRTSGNPFCFVVPFTSCAGVGKRPSFS